MIFLIDVMGHIFLILFDFPIELIFNLFESNLKLSNSLLLSFNSVLKLRDFEFKLRTLSLIVDYDTFELTIGIIYFLKFANKIPIFLLELFN